MEPIWNDSNIPTKSIDICDLTVYGTKLVQDHKHKEIMYM